MPATACGHDRFAVSILDLHPFELKAVIVAQMHGHALAHAPGKARLMQRDVADLVLVDRERFADQRLPLGRSTSFSIRSVSSSIFLLEKLPTL